MNRKRFAAGAICWLSVCAVLSGCGAFGKEPLERPYSFEERRLTLEPDREETGSGQLFAADLCVIEDESMFDAGAVTSEAAALFSIDDEQVMYSKNAFERLYPASITKVMTAIVRSARLCH